MGTASIISIIGTIIGAVIGGAQGIDKYYNGGHSGVGTALNSAQQFNNTATSFGQLFTQLKSLGGK